MSAKSRTLLVPLLCAVALLASACGANEPEEVTRASSPSSPASSEATVAPNENTPAPDTSTRTNEDTESPLADLLGIPFNDDDAADQYFDELGRQAEVKIAECMREKGFDYQVIDYSQFDVFDESIDTESREFAEEYGFGIASSPFEASLEAFEFEDPNEDVLKGATEGERAAYESALRGDLSDEGGDFQNQQPGGCQGEAFDEVFAFVQVFDQFGNQFEEIEQAYYADSRIVAVTTEWVTCMSQAGHNFAEPDDAEEDIERRYRAIITSPEAQPETNAEPEGDGDDGRDFGPATLTPAAQALVDDLAVEERVVARASWDCNGPLREIEDDVRVEYEQRFVDENGPAIAAVLGE